MPTPQQRDSLKALLGNNSLSAQRQQVTDLAFEDTDQGGNFDPRRLATFLGAEQAQQADDPWAQHYEDMGKAQSQETLYNRPGQQQQRGDALERALAPVREKARFDTEARTTQQGIDESEFQRRDATQRRGQDMTQGRGADSQGRLRQNQQNSQLESRAKTAEQTGRAGYNPMTWMFGQPTGAEQAAELRGQQQFGAEDVQTGAEDFSNPQYGDTAFDEEGRPLKFDGVGWAIVGT